MAGGTARRLMLLAAESDPEPDAQQRLGGEESL